MLFKYNKSVFSIPTHQDKTLMQVAIMEFVWPNVQPVLIPGEILYFPQAWQKDNLVQRKYSNYVQENQEALNHLIIQIKRIVYETIQSKKNPS